MGRRKGLVVALDKVTNWRLLATQDKADTRVSPLEGAMEGMPPLRLDVSASEMLLDHSVLPTEKIRLALEKTAAFVDRHA